MRVLHVSDIHEARPKKGEGPSSKMQGIARQADAKAIIFHGDLTAGIWCDQNGSGQFFDRMGELKGEARNKEQVIGDMGTVLRNFTYVDGMTDPLPVYAVTGNHDGITRYAVSGDRIIGQKHETVGLDIANETPGVRSLNFRTEDIGDLTYGGVPGHKWIRRGGATPVEFSEHDIKEKLSGLGAVDVLVAHSQPAGTLLDRTAFPPLPEDRSSFPPIPGEIPIMDGSGYKSHGGSYSIRSYIDKAQPLGFAGGHIHETSGQSDLLGRTRAYSVPFQQHGGHSVANGNVYVIDFADGTFEKIPVA
ncbi:MAG: metallophosphoesterase [Candidatus Aenigmatarchaeota archaeon]|nr:MAG: metallophosphoesterase [Candidatus Aenigmarchaeota archaeon]